MYMFFFAGLSSGNFAFRNIIVEHKKPKSTTQIFLHPARASSAPREQ